MGLEAHLRGWLATACTGRPVVNATLPAPVLFARARDLWANAAELCALLGVPRECVSSALCTRPTLYNYTHGLHDAGGDERAQPSAMATARELEATYAPMRAAQARLLPAGLTLLQRGSHACDALLGRALVT